MDRARVAGDRRGGAAHSDRREEYHLRASASLLHAEREPSAVLDSLKAQLGLRHVRGAISAAPDPAGRRDGEAVWVARYEDVAAANRSSRVIHRWDTASKEGAQNDWSVCTTWFIRESTLLSWRMSCAVALITQPSRTRTTRSSPRAHNPIQDPDRGCGRRNGAHCGIEEAGLNGIAVEPERDKQTRMSVASAKFEAGQVYFPEVGALACGA